MEARKSVVEARTKAETDMAQLPAGSDTKKDVESGENSEHVDEKTTEENGYPSVRVPGHLAGGKGRDEIRHSGISGEGPPSKDGMLSMAVDG
jgi:hypothetical protein